MVIGTGGGLERHLAIAVGISMTSCGALPLLLMTHLRQMDRLS